MKFSVPLPKVIDDDLAFSVEDQGVYAAPAVRRVRVSNDRTVVEVECDDGADEAEVRAVFETYVRDFVARFRRVAGKVLREFEREQAPRIETDVYRKLVRRGWVVELGRGQVGLAGPALRLFRHLDATWARVAAQRLGAVEQSYPTLIPIGVLGRCGYFSSFPHLVSLVSHFVEDYRLLKQVRDANADGAGTDAPVVIPDRGAVAEPEACVTPATCYHCYQALEGATLPDPGCTYTAIGRCCRFESHNMAGLDRLWEFSMREWIFVGDEGWVSGRREAAIDLMSELIRAWDIECRIETANDPFFAPISATKSFWQSQSRLKYETRLRVEPGPDGAPRSISACSFNLHETFFGDTFHISLASGAPVWTGCVGIGVDRWVLACFTQHGFEPQRWPDALRGAVWG